MSKCIDLTGQKFERLTVVKKEHSRIAPSGQVRAFWLCKCDCGKEVVVSAQGLKRGSTKSCGCFQREYMRDKQMQHNLTNTPLYNKWVLMRRRCFSANDKRYRHYGGRGITVCQEWKNSFQAFYNWAIRSGYKEGLTIERINVNGNYEPSNCRWATWKEQANNKTTNRFIKYKGECHTVAEWSEITGIRTPTLWRRLNSGWSVEKALETPLMLNKYKLK